MRILIITMDDPVKTSTFIKTIVKERKGDVVGLAVSKGGRMRISKGKSKVAYLFSLMLIMGPIYFLQNSLITLGFKIRKKLSKYKICKNPSLETWAAEQGIRTFNITTPNSRKFLAEVNKMDIDVIINQSQSILKKGIISVPKLGIINRHNALLPKNRGRLTPFWVLYKQEPETGVSIHFIEEGIDTGDVIVQKRFPIPKGATFKNIVDKNYQVAPIAMLEALKKLENGDTNYIVNDNNNASYNSTPTFSEALDYRMNRLFGRKRRLETA